MFPDLHQSKSTGFFPSKMNKKEDTYSVSINNDNKSDVREFVYRLLKVGELESQKELDQWYELAIQENAEVEQYVASIKGMVQACI